jgi:hypothetical protein
MRQLDYLEFLNDDFSTNLDLGDKAVRILKTSDPNKMEAFKNGNKKAKLINGVAGAAQSGGTFALGYGGMKYMLLKQEGKYADTMYNVYLNKCKERGKKPLKKSEWLSKEKKKAAITAGAGAAVGLGSVVGSQYNKKKWLKGDYDKLKEDLYEIYYDDYDYFVEGFDSVILNELFTDHADNAIKSASADGGNYESGGKSYFYQNGKYYQAADNKLGKAKKMSLADRMHINKSIKQQNKAEKLRKKAEVEEMKARNSLLEAIYDNYDYYENYYDIY